MSLTPFKRILQAINDSEKPISPIEVYKQILPFVDIKPSTVRKYIARWLKKKKIRKLYTGLYVSHRLYGVMQGDLRVENLRFHVNAAFLPKFPKIKDIIEYNEGVKIFIQFGIERKKISCSITQREDLKKWERGFTKNTLVLAINRAIDLMNDRVESLTDKPLDDGFVISTFECNKDYGGKRLDGKLTCFTKQDFFETITKVYLKDNQTVRAERKISTSMAVNNAVEMLTGEPLDGQVSSGLLTINQNLTRFTVAQKYGNRQMADLRVELSKVVSCLDKKSGSVDELVHSRLSVLEEHVGLLMDMERVNTESLIKLSKFLKGLLGVSACEQEETKIDSSVVSGGNPFVC